METSLVPHASPRPAAHALFPYGARPVANTNGSPPIDFAAAAREHRQFLMACAFRLTRDAHEAADLVQDTFERAMKSERTLRASGRSVPREKVRGWLAVILRNLFIDLRRSGRRSRLCEPLNDDLLVAAEAPDDEPAPSWTRVGPEAVGACLPRLSVELRAAFELGVAGLPYAEIASRLGIPVATVCTRMYRARQRLRVLLTKELAAASPAGS